jgi:hypothetical protein
MKERHMDDLLELSLHDLLLGFSRNPSTGRFVCAVCGQAFEKGEVFRIEDRYFDAEAATAAHVRSEHGGMLNVLLSLDKKLTGLTENQKELLTMMRDGMADRDIAAKTGTAPATIRHQRFVFREKARQAKLYLAVFELALGEKQEIAGSRQAGDDFIKIHRGAKMVDERYQVTTAEENVILSNMFSSLEPLKLKILSPKEKKKIVILKRISEEFETGRRYTEKELTAILKSIYDDHATLRRYLIEYGFMDRTQDCTEYWRT